MLSIIILYSAKIKRLEGKGIRLKVTEDGILIRAVRSDTDMPAFDVFKIKELVQYLHVSTHTILNGYV